MKNVRLLVMMVFVLAGMSVAEEPVHFADEVLKKAVGRKLSIRNPTPRHMQNLKYLKISDSIRDLEGLQYAENLAWVQIAKNPKIEDFSVLASLPNLKKLSWAGCQQSNLSTLSSLTQLEDLTLNNCQLSDISALASLTNLVRLDLTANNVSDVSPLKSLNNLTYLNLHRNNVSDFSSLESLSNLKRVYLRNNKVTEISSLKSVFGVTRFDTKNNPVQIKYFAIRLTIASAIVISIVTIFAVLDWKKSQRIHILPNLSFMLSVAAPIVYLFGNYLCQSVLSGTHTERWQHWGLVVFAAISGVFAGAAMAMLTLAKSREDSLRTGRKRAWLAIAICVLFGGGVLLAFLLNEIAGNMMI